MLLQRSFRATLCLACGPACCRSSSIDKETAAFLLPGYLGCREGKAADVTLGDSQSEKVHLPAHAEDMNWNVELHQLALAASEEYKGL